MTLGQQHGFPQERPLNLLLVTYDYPPVGGIAVQRAVKFAKFLPSLGIRPIVLTNGHGVGFVQDATLMPKNHLEGLKTYRVGAHSLGDYTRRRNDGTLQVWERYWRGLINLPWIDVYGQWYRSIRNDLIGLAKDEKIDCVLTTAPPHSTNFIGYFLSRNLGLPWIMDLRDSMTWAPGSHNRLHDRLLRLVERYYETLFVQAASSVITISEPMAENIKRRLGGDARTPLHVIFNGFDADDYQGLKPTPGVPGRMLVAYTGSLRGKQSAQPFFEALRLLITRGLVDPKKLVLRFVGSFGPAALEEFRAIPESVEVQQIDHVPHRDSLEYQMGADLLLLLVTSNTQGVGSEVLTGKVFEYMASGRPILAVTVPGALQELIEGGRFGATADYRSIESVAEAFLGLYRQWANRGSVEYSPLPGALQRYSRRAQSNQLATVIRAAMTSPHPAT